MSALEQVLEENKQLKKQLELYQYAYGQLVKYQQTPKEMYEARKEEVLK